MNQVERAVAEAAIRASWALGRLEGAATGTAVTVIGAGAAGLSAAYQLARRGYDVTLADPHDEPGANCGTASTTRSSRARCWNAEIARILALGVTFAGRADLAAAESAAQRLVKTKVYESGSPVAVGAIAAAVHFGRRAAALVDADVSGTAGEAPAKLPPVDKRKVQPDYHLHAPRGEAIGETWPPGAAIAEARRCLSCGGCFECDNCYKYCPDQAVLRPLAPGEPYRFKLEFCQGCNKCAEQCPSGYIDMR